MPRVTHKAPVHPMLKCSRCLGQFPPAGLRVRWEGLGFGWYSGDPPRRPVLYCAKCDPDMRRA